MNITMFIASLTGGGAERQIAEMANLFSRYGHNISMVTYSDLIDDYYICSDVKRIRLAENKGRLAKWIAILKYFLKTADDGVISFLPGCSRFVVLSSLLRYRRPYKILAGERSAMTAPSGVQLQMIKVLYRWVDYVVANSYTQADQIREINPKLRNKILTITNYADLKRYSVSTYKHSPVLRIVILAHYRKEKNCLNLLKMANLLKERTTVPFRIEWYGRKYDDVYNECAQYVEEHNIGHIVSLNDRIDDVAHILSESDALCLPSLQEGFSNSIAEAICSGVPVLASDVSDNSIMVHNHVNGYLFDPNDVEDMCRAFMDFLKLSDEDRQRMGQQSRMIAEQVFDEKTFVDSYINLIAG